MNKSKSLLTCLTLLLALLLVGSGCKRKSSDKSDERKLKPRTSLGTERIPTSKPTVLPLLTGYPSLDRRPGPQHAIRQKVADKLERCLLSADSTGDCFVDTARARMIDAKPPVEASGKEAVAAMMKNGFGLGLSAVKSKPIVTMVKGREAVLICHVQGVASDEFLGVNAQDKPVGLVGALYVRYDTSERIVEVQAFIDQLSALGQVGGTSLAYRPAAPAPAEAPVEAPVEAPAEVPVDVPAGVPVRALASGYGSEAKNLQIMQYITGDLDQHDKELMGRYYGPESVISRSWQPADFQGIGPLLDSYAVEFKGTSNSRHTVKWEWVAQDHVAMLIERSGTSTGPLFGNDTASNRSYTIQELHIMRIRDGLLDKHWVFANGLGLANQIGIEIKPGK